MKSILLKSAFSFIFSVCFYSLFAQTNSGLIRKADSLNAAMNDAQAIIAYKEALTAQPSNVYVLCKCSELSSRIGGRLKDDKQKEGAFCEAARTYAVAALRVNPFSSEANFVMSLVMGTDAMRKGGKEKIDAVRDIKKYAELSIKFDAQNYKAWFVLGKWFYEINALNYFERTAVRIFFGALPPATIDDAIHCFEKTKSINPGFVLNYLALAKAYKKKDEQNTARQNLDVMFSLPDKTQDDEKIKTEGRSLLKQWN